MSLGVWSVDRNDAQSGRCSFPSPHPGEHVIQVRRAPFYDKTSKHPCCVLGQGHTEKITFF